MTKRAGPRPRGGADDKLPNCTVLCAICFCNIDDTHSRCCLDVLLFPHRNGIRLQPLVASQDPNLIDSRCVGAARAEIILGGAGEGTGKVGRYMQRIYKPGRCSPSWPWMTRAPPSLAEGKPRREAAAPHHYVVPPPGPHRQGHDGVGGCHRSPTLQLTQKLDAYGIWAARVDWAIGPPPHSCLCCTVRCGTVAVCTVHVIPQQRKGEIVCVCGPHASHGGGASARCTSCRSALGYLLRLPAGQER